MEHGRARTRWVLSGSIKQHDEGIFLVPFHVQDGLPAGGKLSLCARGETKTQ